MSTKAQRSETVSAAPAPPAGDAVACEIERLRLAMGLDMHVRREDVVKLAADRLSARTPTSDLEELKHAHEVLWGPDHAPGIGRMSGPGWAALFGV